MKKKDHYRITIDVVAEHESVDRCADIEHHLYMISNKLIPYSVSAEKVEYKVEKLEKLKEKREMLYSELLEMLKPYSDRMVWFMVDNTKTHAKIDFYIEGEIHIILSRRWADTEIEVEVKDVRPK